MPCEANVDQWETGPGRQILLPSSYHIYWSKPQEALPEIPHKMRQLATFVESCGWQSNTPLCVSLPSPRPHLRFLGMHSPLKH